MIDATHGQAASTIDDSTRASMPLHWPVGLRAELFEAARRGYPHEVCGLLIGRADAGAITVEHMTEAANVVSDRPADRYQLDPQAFLTADEAARRDGLEIVGIWHTHPDHTARPSPTDLEAAWEGYTYVILSVTRENVADCTAWRLGGGKFVEQSIEEKTP